MRTRWTVFAAASAVAALSAGASAAENGLLGIKLFDSGVKVVTLYGSPDEIQPVNVGGMGAGGGGGAAGGGGAGMPSVGGASGGGGGGAGGSAGTANFSFGDWVIRQGGPMMPPAPGGGRGGAQGPTMGGAGGRGGGQAPAAGGGAADNASYTRWVYNRSGSKYGFIIDNQGRVVQIEAIGLSNPKVKTSKGVTFGTSFANVVKKYQTPDGYDISGDNVLARFLNKEKVAFRFARLGPGKPQVVTGIVVAAGKG